MIRPTTVLCLIAALGSGLYLYTEKHRTEMLDRDIARVFKATQAAHERTGLLRVEWAQLNEPGRLQDLAARYLALAPMAPAQLVQLSDLPQRLPAPAAAVPGGSTDDDVADASSPSDAPLPAAGATDASGEAAAEGSKIPARILAQADIKPHAPHRLALAKAETPRIMMRPVGAPLPLAAPQPVGASYMSALARPLPQRRMPPVVAAVPSYPTASPFVGSALGGGAHLPPPVPYGSGDR